MRQRKELPLPDTFSQDLLQNVVRQLVCSRNFLALLGVLAAGILFGLLAPHSIRFTGGVAVATVVAIFAFPGGGRLAPHVWAPLAGMALLVVVPPVWAAITGLVEWAGGVGAETGLAAGAIWDGVRQAWQPWVLFAGLWHYLEVPLLILCLAYMSISLDESGFFEWCSLKIIAAGRGSGMRLLVMIFLGVSLLTYFTSNDIVILSMTPILVHLARNAGIRNMVPFLITQFMAANCASMGLYIGNPTNIVIAGAVGIGFMEYAVRMFFPTLAATGLTMGLLLLLFRVIPSQNRLQSSYQVAGPDDAVSTGGGEGKGALGTSMGRWPHRATIKAVLFGLCIIVLGAFANPPVIGRLFAIDDPGVVSLLTSRVIVLISFLFALIMAVYDLVTDWKSPVVAAGTEGGAKSGVWARTGSRRGFMCRGLKKRASRMPWEIVVFFLGFCVILNGLEQGGLVGWAVSSVEKSFGGQLAATGAVAQNGGMDGLVGRAFAGALASGFYGVLAVNTMNNIPATLLFEKMWSAGLGDSLAALHPAFLDIFVDCCLFASNFAANLTFIGALAGLMWLRILKDSSLPYKAAGQVAPRLPRSREFLLYGVAVVPVVTIGTCLLIAVLRVFTV